MSSSRSIAAARNRRAGDSGLQARMPVKQPVKSIQNSNLYANHNNGHHKMSNMSNTMNSNSNGLPFSKLTVSDAVGLITLRLGKVEQHLIDMQNGDGNTSFTSDDTTKSLDNSVITTIVNRLDALEKKDIHTQSVIKNIHDEITSIKKSLDKVSEMNSKMEHNMSVKFDEIDMGFVEIEKTIDEIMSNVNENQAVEGNDSVEESEENVKVEVTEVADENVKVEVTEASDENDKVEVTEASDENVKVELTEVEQVTNVNEVPKEANFNAKNAGIVDSIKEEVSKSVNEKKGGKKKNKNNSVNLEM
jgi:hypothetical protein